METAIGVTGLIIQIIEVIPGTLQKINNWNLSRKHVPGAINSFNNDIETLSKNFERIEKWYGEVRGLCPHRICSEFSDLPHQFQQIRTKQNELKTSFDTLSNRSDKKIMFFPNSRKEELENLHKKRIELTSAAFNILSSVREIEKAVNNFINMAPLPESTLVLDFEGDSSEKRLRDAILDTQSSKIFGAVARGRGAIALGPGGIGKTQTICTIAHLPETRLRFLDGIFFTKLGEESNPQQLINGIADFAFEIGAEREYAHIREFKKIEDAVKCAAHLFRNHSCLFIFDDVWPLNGIQVNILEILANIARHPKSKVAYTSRDQQLLGGTPIFFGDRSYSESERILWKCSGLQRPLQETALQSYQNILNQCNGLPIALSISGKTIRSLAARRESFGQTPDLAWKEYDMDWGGDQNMELMQIVLTKAIKVLSIAEETNYWQLFDSLCVLQKAEQVPLFVMKKIWGLSDSTCSQTVKKFERFSVIRLDRGFKSQDVITYGLHDIVLDVCRHRAKEKEIFETMHLNLVLSYSPISNYVSSKHHVDNNSNSLCDRISEFKNWWLDIDDDGFIFERIVSLLQVGKEFEVIIWLVNRPKWIVKQLEANGLYQVLSDLRKAIDCVGSIDAWNQTTRPTIVQWLNTLRSAMVSSYQDIKVSSWPGMVWTQLYGRLQYFRNRNACIEKFLSEIEDQSPKPWLKPPYGVIPHPTSNITEQVDLDDDETFLDLAEIDGELIVVAYNKTRQAVTLNRYKYGIEEKVTCIDIFTRKPNEWVNLATFVNGDLYGNHSVYLKINSTNIVQLKTRFNVNSSTGTSSTSSNVPVSSIDGPWLESWFPEINDMMQKIESMDATPKGDMVVTGTTAGSVILWQEKGGVWERTTLIKHREMVTSVSTNENGNRVVYGSGDGTVRVLDIVGEEPKHTVIGHFGNKVDVVKICKRGNLIVSSGDRDVCVWNNVDNTWEKTTLEGNRNGMESVYVSENGDQIISNRIHSGVLDFWKEDDKAWVHSYLKVSNCRMRSVILCDNGRRVVVASDDGVVRVLDWTNNIWKPEAIIGHMKSVISVSIGNGETRIVTGSNDKTVRVWDYTEGLWEQTILFGHKHNVRSVSVCGNVNRIVSGSHDKTIRVWGKIGRTWKQTDVLNFDDYVREVFLCKSGNRIISGLSCSKENDSTNKWSVCVLDRAGDSWRQTFPIRHISISKIKVCKHGTRIVFFGYKESTITVLDYVGSRWETNILKGHKKEVYAVDNCEQVDRIVSISDDKTVRVWGRFGADWKQTALLYWTEFLRDVRISDDGRFISSIDKFYKLISWGLGPQGVWETCNNRFLPKEAATYPCTNTHNDSGNILSIDALKAVKLMCVASYPVRNGFAIQFDRKPYFGFLQILL